MSEERLDKLEVIIATQEQQIQDLSEMVNAQWKEIDRLKILLKKTEDKIISIEDSIESPEANSPPPHY